MIVIFDELGQISKKHPNNTIVLTSGTYDLFHIGHLNYLQLAKSQGEILVVMLSSDQRIKARKGNKRPIIPQNERAQIIDSLKCVDYVFIDPGINESSDQNPVYDSLLSSLKPQIYVTDGPDERLVKILEKHNVKFMELERQSGGKYSSTTEIVEHLKKL